MTYLIHAESVENCCNHLIGSRLYLSANLSEIPVDMVQYYMDNDDEYNSTDITIYYINGLELVWDKDTQAIFDKRLMQIVIKIQNNSLVDQ